ncbi:MAG: glycogen synthase GlgA [Eubacteriales bacterium]|nr:glycogen synthase GlgA [Eubacteriales bacterium]
MKILFASPEVAPFIKTGGLADVAGSLPPALAELGHDVRVILPLYEQIGEDWRSQMTFVKYYYVRLAWRSIYCGLFQLERNGVTYYFVDNESYFKRQGIYGHFDDAERFAYFSRAVIETPGQIDFKPDIIHCNDWQTALVPIYLLEERYRQNTLSRTKSVFTIHNIEYQGRYGRDLLEDLFGLDESYFNENMLKFYNDISLVKGAVNAADYVTTVSPNYANELQFSFYAHGLEGVIAVNRGKLRGILNGIDMKANDPSTRKDLAARFTSRNHKGKAKCKAALQERLGLKVDPNVPIIACISRLVGHKGFELVCQAFRGIMDMEVQFVLLGTGEWGYEQFFRNAQNEYPGRVSANILYDGALSDAIYAGADLFLMPSIAEPCGLSQMFAMRYGTVPVVRMTGGLLDSVPAYNPEENTGLGFTFGSVDAGDMLGALYRAVGVYYDDKKAWDQLVTRDMEADFSWDRSAQEYVDVYRTITGLE